MSAKWDVRVYIAGPITVGVLDDNIRQANEAMVALMRAGIAPFNPMLSCFVGWPLSRVPGVTPNGMTHDDWYGMDLAWVDVCRGLLRLPGVSVGADGEVAYARRIGIPVFYDVDVLIATLLSRPLSQNAQD